MVHPKLGGGGGGGDVRVGRVMNKNFKIIFQRKKNVFVFF